MASRRRVGAVRAELARRGLATTDLSRIQAPAGLDLGTATQEQVALPVRAAITRLRRTGPQPHPAEVLEVDVASACHRAEWGGRTPISAVHTAGRPSRRT